MLPNGFTLRKFQPPDQAAVRQLILDGLATRYAVLKPELNPDLADIAAHYLQCGAYFVVVADEKGLLCACGALIPEEGQPQAQRIVRVSVAPTHQRQGLARALCQHLLAEAQRRSAQRVWVETNDDWHSALALYQQLGFQEHHRDFLAEWGYAEVQMTLELN